MSVPTPAPELLDREFLEIRAKLLQLAASFDRLDRADGAVGDDPRMDRIREALDLLGSGDPDRAEQIQLIFSRQYDDDWQSKFEMPSPK